MDQLRDLLYHHFAIDFVLCLIKLKLSFLFLRVEHDTPRVSQLLLHVILELVMFVVGVVLVMPRAIRVLVILSLVLASLFAPLQELEKLGHGVLNERVCNVCVFYLVGSVCLNSLFYRFHALLALNANIREVILTQLQQIH